MPVAAAIAGAAVVGAGASIYSASKASKAQKKAAQMQAGTEEKNLALQERLFNQQRSDQEPWRQAGMTALQQLQAMTRPGGANQSELESDPGYQFRLSQGVKARDQSASSKGALYSGAAQKGIERFGQGVGSEEFGNRFNRISTLAGFGQNANNATGQASQNFGAQSAAGSARLGDAYAQRGNAAATGWVGVGQGINNAASSVGNYFLMKDLWAK